MADAALALDPPGYRDVGLTHWLRAESGAYDAVGRALADGHYSRRKIGAPQFMPPGNRFALITRDHGAVWGWWRPHPRSGIKAMNGLDGWTCVIFRRVHGAPASELVLDAERALVVEGVGCGPSGMLTYVWDAKVQSGNPGYCYKSAGWHTAGKRHACCKSFPQRSADGKKTLLHKPFELAGASPAPPEAPTGERS